jgi:hypothetical protein
MKPYQRVQKQATSLQRRNDRDASYIDPRVEATVAEVRFNGHASFTAHVSETRTTALPRQLEPPSTGYYPTSILLLELHRPLNHVAPNPVTELKFSSKN